MAEQDLAARIEARLRGRRCDKGSVTLLGGCFLPERLDDFLAPWLSRTDLPWRLWEYASAIRWAGEPDDTRWLERARLFGDGGDLSLRRDGACWYWGYVGEGKIQIAAGFRRQDYWATHATPLYCQEDQRLLLWGARTERGGRAVWWEDRVGGPEGLRYHVEGSPERVQLVYRAYTHGERTEFVWCRKLEGER